MKPFRRQRQYDDINSGATSFASDYYQQQNTKNHHHRNLQYNNRNNNAHNNNNFNSQDFPKNNNNYEGNSFSSLDKSNSTSKNDSQSLLDEIFGQGNYMKRRDSSASNPASPTMKSSENNNDNKRNRKYVAPENEENTNSSKNGGERTDGKNNNKNSKQQQQKQQEFLRASAKNGRKIKQNDDDDEEIDDDDDALMILANTASSSANSFPSSSKKYGNFPSGNTSKNKNGENEDDDNDADDDQRLEKLVLQLTPTPQECARRFAAFRELRDLLKRRLGLYIYVFGSQRTGIALPSSDVDVVVRNRPLKTSSALGNPDSETDTDDDGFEEQNRKSQAKVPHQQPNHDNNASRASSTTSSRNARGRREMPPHFEQVLRVLRQDPHKFGDIKPIVHAKVPIIKLKHRQTQVEIDVSFQDDGLETSRYLSRQFDNCKNGHKEPARGLVVLLKAFMAGLALNDPAQHGVGSFVCSMLVLWYLNFRRRGVDATATAKNTSNDDQVSADQKTKTKNKKNLNQKDDENGNNETTTSPTKKSLVSYFTDLLHFYCYEFDTMRYGVDCGNWSAFDKHVSQELTMLNPLERSRNCSSAATLFIPAVLPAMEALYQKIMTEDSRRSNNKSSNGENRNNLQQQQQQQQKKKKNKKMLSRFPQSSPPLTAVSATGELVDEDSLPNWILFPKIYVLGSASIVRSNHNTNLKNNGSKQRNNNNKKNNNNNLFSFSLDGNNNYDADDDDENNNLYFENEFVLDRDFNGGRSDASALMNFFDEDGKNLYDESTGRRIPKTLAWTRRWSNLETLKQSVTNIPSVDAEGFYCALSL